MGSPQIQADGPLDQGREGLVRSAAPRESSTLCPLATMPRQRPNIGSRMNREVHVRFWERPEVKALRATRHFRPIQSVLAAGSYPLRPDKRTILEPAHAQSRAVDTWAVQSRTVLFSCVLPSWVAKC